MASIGSEDGDIGFQIAPMVDVVFVLMLFFMASAGSQVVERELTINLPGGNSTRTGKPAKPPIIVDISPEGQVTMNNQPYGNATDRQLQPLRDWVKNYIDKFGTDDPFILRPASETKHERIMDVLNAAGASGVKNLSFSG